MSNSKPLKVDYFSRAMPLAIEKLHLSEDQADIHFIVKAADGTFERVPAHKFLLMSMSSVFRAMFSGLWAERDEVEIVDSSAAAFREFLQFFYSTDIKLTMENALGVMILVDKYDVDDSIITRTGSTEKICENFVMNNLTTYNVRAVHELAMSLNLYRLAAFCGVICLNSKETFASEGFLKIDRESLKRILQLNCLNYSKLDVLKALLDWIKARLEPNDFTAENIRSQFGDLLHEIRFKQISVLEFSSLSKSFTCNEISQILLAVGSNRPTISVEADVDGKIVCDRLFTYQHWSKPYYIKDKEATTFSVNNSCLLIAFDCFLGVHHDTKHCQLENDLPCKITIVELESGDLLQSGDKKILHEQQVVLPKENDKISLSKAILVRPGLLYKIEMELTPPENCSVNALIKSFVKTADVLAVEFYNDPTVDNKIRSVIRTLIFASI